MGRLAGKSALVTGAASGIGEATARLFAAEGARLLLTDINEEGARSIARDIGHSARSLHHDVASASNWQAAIADVQSAFGGLDILINCAGVIAHSPLQTCDEAEFDRLVNINQRGVFLGMKMASPLLEASGRGAIVNISSVAGLHGTPAMLQYTATKFAVRGLTRAAAHDLAPLGIRVNAVMPGPIATPAFRGVKAEGFQDAVVQAVPLKRVGLPVEVARAMMFLASDEASYVTGAELRIDGGMCA